MKSLLVVTFQRLFGTSFPTGASRAFALTALLGSTGNGMFAASAVLFFTKSVDTSTQRASLALTAAGAAAIGGNAIAGRYAVRLPAVRTMVLLCGARAVIYACLAAVGSYAMLVPIVCLALTLDLINQPIKQALMREVLAPEERRQSFALQRSIINAAFALGATIAGVTVSLDSGLALRALILANALLFLPMMVIYGRLRDRAPTPAGGEDADAQVASVGRTSPWRDARYVLFSTANGLMTVSDAVTFFALPLWIVSSTDAPIAVLSVVLVMNTAVTALMQARCARIVIGLRRGALSLGAAGLLLALSCLAFWAASDGGAVAATAWLVLGGALLSVAEALYSTAGWEVSVEMAPKGLHAHYFSVTSGFSALSEMVGPVVLASLVLPRPDVGWAGLGLLFAGAGTTAWLAVQTPRQPWRVMA